MSKQIEAKSAETEEEEEAIHFTRVIKSFQAYKKDALGHVAACERQFKDLSENHQKYLPNHMHVLEQKRTCIEYNNVVCQLIVRRCENAFQNKEFEEIRKDTTDTKPRPMDLDKVRTTLKQIVRDWSLEGEFERATCYKIVTEEILTRLPISRNGHKSSVLVPGCGLGRLAWEIARLGYRCEGNEFSFFMLFTSDFILNHTPQSSKQDFHQFQIYPWVTGKCNVKSWETTLRPIKFPDVNPADLPENSEFSMAAGDFLECYESACTWNCVATCYFMDTAHNIISYIERIFDILTPGGLWVNFGPLLYHFSDMHNESSVEFSYEEVLEITKNVGFRIIKEERDVPSTYINNTSSMLQYTYHCALLVAEKPVL